jgi:hypothetical protein
MVGMPCLLAISSPISSSTVPLVRLGFRDLPKKVKKKGQVQSENAQSESRKSTRNAMTSTDPDALTSSPARDALTLRYHAVALGPRGWLGKRSSPASLS